MDRVILSPSMRYSSCSQVLGAQGVEEWVVKILKPAVPDDLLKTIKQVIKKKPVKSPLPGIIAGDKFTWMDDDKFGRQMLAGINPTVIQCLQRFPKKAKME